MSKKKIALFFDDDTEKGKQILNFLTPLSKRKSDIVGELILLWIMEHGTNVPIQWLDRNKGDTFFVKPFFPKIVDDELQTQENERKEKVKSVVVEEDESVKQQSDPDASLIKAGLASFLS